MMNDDESTPTLATASTGPSKPSNRAKAEARRRRILEASKRRLQAVGGDTTDTETTETSSNPTSELSPVTSDNIPTENSNDLTMDTTNVATGTSNVVSTDSTADAAATTETETASASASAPVKKTSSGNARLAQMRRRRFKKASAAANSSTANSSTNSSTNNYNSIANTVETPTLESNPSTPNDIKPIKEDKTSTSTEESIQKKKYIGVAKMRRQMLKRQKQKAQTSIQTDSSTPTSTNTTIPSTSSSSSSDFTTKLLQQQIRTTLFLKSMILVCLFFSGFYVGYQNTTLTAPIYVDNHLALIHRSHIVNKIRGTSSLLTDSDSDSTSYDDQKWDIPPASHNDEFSSESIMDPPLLDPTANIDPLFRVNLDIYTQGDGFLSALARQAVKLHRFGTRLLLGGYTFFPPLFCILCLLIRNSTTRLALPYLFGITQTYKELLEMEQLTKKRMEESESQSNSLNFDVVEMVSNAVKKMVGGVVPDFFWIGWQCWWDLRKDMYVVLCGLLFGLIFPLMKGSFGMSAVVEEHGEL